MSATLERCQYELAKCGFNDSEIEDTGGNILCLVQYFRGGRLALVVSIGGDTYEVGFYLCEVEFQWQDVPLQFRDNFDALADALEYWRELAPAPADGGEW